MSSYFAARGCVYRVEQEGGSEGWYKVAGLGRGDPTSPILVLGLELNAAGLVQPVTALDNSKFLYTFGEDFAALTVSGDILLGPAGGSVTQSMKKVQEFFNTNQVVVSKKPVSISGPGVAYSVYLTGLTFGRVDPEFHVQPWALIGVVADSVKG